MCLAGFDGPQSHRQNGTVLDTETAPPSTYSFYSFFFCLRQFFFNKENALWISGVESGSGSTFNWEADRRRVFRLVLGEHGEESGDFAWRTLSAVEILVQWEQSVRFQFPERPPQLLLDSIHMMEEFAPVDLEATATKNPICPQQIVEFEDFELDFI